MEQGYVPFTKRNVLSKEKTVLKRKKKPLTNQRLLKECFLFSNGTSVALDITHHEL
jgi:hypothetical protein